jgi:hypothetical protein
MVLMLWSLLGFPVIRALLPSTKFTAVYFTAIFPKIGKGIPFELAKFTPTTNVAHRQRHRAPSLGIDHMFEKIPNQSIDHPPYSLDLAPSGLCLFGKLKGALAGQEVESTKEFFSRSGDHWLHRAGRV